MDIMASVTIDMYVTHECSPLLPVIYLVNIKMSVSVDNFSSVEK